LGRAGVHAKAAILLRARNRLHRPKFLEKLKQLHIIDAHGGMSSPQCRRALDDVIRKLGIAKALRREQAIEAVALRLIDEIRFSS
jgi:hypothetical protein